MDVFEERKARLATADNMRASIAMHHVTKGGEFLRAGDLKGHSRPTATRCVCEPANGREGRTIARAAFTASASLAPVW